MGSDGQDAGRPDVTLRTIAGRANVHISTVSRALSSTESDKLNPETLARIRSIADELGYEPNPWGRSLRTQRSMSIGLVVPRLTDGVLAVMFEAAEDYARSHGFQTLLGSTRDDPSEQDRLVDAMLERRVDGLLLATPVVDDPILARLSARGVPFVLVNRSATGHPQVRADDRLGGDLVTTHLLESGHRRIGMIGGLPNVSTSIDRRRGFLDAHERHGVDSDPALMVMESFSDSAGHRMASRLLAMPDRPTAFFAINDAVAIGAMAAVRDARLRVPEDVAIAGYNDSAIVAMLPVPLTSVRISLTEMGTLAAEQLVGMLGGKAATSIVLEPTLAMRRSTTGWVSPDA